MYDKAAGYLNILLTKAITKTVYGYAHLVLLSMTWEGFAWLRLHTMLQAMRKAARKLQGEHDYRNFCKMDINNGVTNYTRRIMSFTVEPKPGVRYAGQFAGPSME